jgi:hypothetical protein
MMVRKQFTIPEKMAEDLRKTAYKTKQSQSEIVRKGLDRVLKEAKHGKT